MSELYLKDEKVLTLKDIGGVPGDIAKINNPELLPICLKKKCTMKDLKEWLSLRGIPETREGLSFMREKFGTSWEEIKNYASLTDHYWIKKRNEPWKKVNFFTNVYSRDIGDMAFMPWTITKKRIDPFSPDLTTNGILRKCWRQNLSDRTSYLVKAGSAAAHQEPLSEVLVSVLAETLGIIPCVKYDLHVEGTTMCSKCDNFITLDIDLVPASYIYDFEEKKENETVYSHLLRMCEVFDIPGAEEFLEGVIFIDHITGNEDRNLSNIAFIRDIKTMKFIGPAPLFDSGNAYWSTKKISSEVRSTLFGDVEEAIFAKLMKLYNLNMLAKDSGYIKLISAYPCINDVKKENLIEAIKKRNQRLIDQPSMDFSR